jgi:hypothetical protein
MLSRYPPEKNVSPYVQQQSHESRSGKIRGVIGPVTSSYGFKNWFLYVTDDAIVALPVSFWITIKAGLWAGLGSSHGMHAVFKAAKPPFVDEIPDTGDPRWRWYRKDEFRWLEVRRAAMSANEIRIQNSAGRVDLYGIVDRAATDSIRQLLFQSYPEVYAEKGFPSSLVVRQ